MRVKTIPKQFAPASRNLTSGATFPAKTANISKKLQVASSSSSGNLAGPSWRRHAGWTPNSSVNKAQRLATKEDWLKFRKGGEGVACTPVYAVISKRISLVSAARWKRPSQSASSYSFKQNTWVNKDRRGRTIRRRKKGVEVNYLMTISHNEE